MKKRSQIFITVFIFGCVCCAGIYVYWRYCKITGTSNSKSNWENNENKSTIRIQKTNKLAEIYTPIYFNNSSANKKEYKKQKGIFYNVFDIRPDIINNELKVPSIIISYRISNENISIEPKTSIKSLTRTKKIIKDLNDNHIILMDALIKLSNKFYNDTDLSIIIRNKLDSSWKRLPPFSQEFKNKLKKI